MVAAFSATEIVAAVADLADPARAVSSARFFKTGPGEYGEGDVFVGVAVPPLRKVAKRFRGVRPSVIRELLDSPIHEHRLLALFLLRAEFERAPSGTEQTAWVELYLTALHDGRVDNWDLVDSSADPILGEWLVARGDHLPLVELAETDDLWCRRTGIVGTFAFLKHGSPDATLAVIPVVIHDRRDLIQKATGWMLRELGKRVDRTVLTDYLNAHAAEMGRTALSYATEHLDPGERAHLRSLR
ncbi:DNA alkylation repair protein [Gordonia hankookensis]|uniref:DNA alkylation repair protein n=1 Tax=Gordonia hankookensis TaxID=589403 RepID=A0ABR7W7V0_9ACTN|nr:DNA alkylation repair protein [Gordonia hankookensis]MBD1318843.1 DNA alkylation repair protein [Gordonia hankookensis]